MKYELFIFEDVITACESIGRTLPETIEISCLGVAECDLQILLQCIYDLPYEQDYQTCDKVGSDEYDLRRFNFHFKRLSMQAYKQKFMNILDFLVDDEDGTLAA